MAKTTSSTAAIALPPAPAISPASCAVRASNAPPLLPVNPAAAPEAAGAMAVNPPAIGLEAALAVPEMDAPPLVAMAEPLRAEALAPAPMDAVVDVDDYVSLGFRDDAEMAEELQFQEAILMSLHSDRRALTSRYTPGSALFRDIFVVDPSSSRQGSSRSARAGRSQEDSDDDDDVVITRVVASTSSAAPHDVISISVSSDDEDAYHSDVITISELAAGHSKSPNFQPQTKAFECPICTDEVPTSQLFCIKDCVHVFCSGCIANYISSKLDDNVSTIGCPEPDCREGVIKLEWCYDRIPQEIIERWGTVLCEVAVGVRKFYCPFNDCSAMLMDDGGEVVKDAQCPYCSRWFCAQCKVPWHTGISCEDYQKLGEDERGQNDIQLRNLASTNNWQRCPQCKMYVERVAGCVFIKCRCAFCFCYLCGSPMTPANHNCSKCHRTW